MSNDLLVQQDGTILRLTLNRPEHGNGATDAMAAEITRLLMAAHEKSEVVILRANGPQFCIGRASMGAPPPKVPLEALARRHAFEVVFDCYDAFRRCQVPVVGVVDGLAAGFGCAIAALCDITIASDRATFQVPEMQHNIMPTVVMSALHDRVPRKALGYLVWSTAIIPAERALAFGIVSHVVARAALEPAVDAVVGQILKEPKVAIMGVKEYIRAALHMDPQGAVAFARNIHATINTSSEMLTKKS